MKRKKYEYAVQWSDGKIKSVSTNRAAMETEVKRINSYGYMCAVLVRREVGDWKGVRNG